MKGMPLIVIGAILTIFSVAWLGNIVPLTIVEFPIQTVPADGMTYTTLKTITAYTPFRYASGSGTVNITAVKYTQDNKTTTYDLAKTETSTGYIFSKQISTPSVGTHFFSFEIYGFPLGDVNNDGIIDQTDLDLLQTKLYARVGDPDYESKYDFNKDGVINLRDISTLSRNFGKSVTITLVETISGTFTISGTEIPEETSEIPEETSEASEPSAEPPPEYRVAKQVKTYEPLIKLGFLFGGIALVALGLYYDRKL